MYDNTFEFEDRVYLDPTLSRDEQMSFVDVYKNIQNRNNQQIVRENYNLGTPITSNLGGLGGGTGDVWKGQYQRPQTDLAIANLRTSAQLSALNQAMDNYKNMLQNRYNQARRRAYNSSGNGTVLPSTDPDTPTTDDVIPENGEGAEVQVKKLDGLVGAFGPLKTQNLLNKASNWAKIVNAMNQATETLDEIEQKRKETANNILIKPVRIGYRG